MQRVPRWSAGGPPGGGLFSRSPFRTDQHLVALDLGLASGADGLRRLGYRLRGPVRAALEVLDALPQGSGDHIALRIAYRVLRRDDRANGTPRCDRAGTLKS